MSRRSRWGPWVWPGTCWPASGLEFWSWRSGLRWISGLTVGSWDTCLCSALHSSAPHSSAALPVCPTANCECLHIVKYRHRNTSLYTKQLSVCVVFQFLETTTTSPELTSPQRMFTALWKCISQMVRVCTLCLCFRGVELCVWVCVFEHLNLLTQREQLSWTDVKQSFHTQYCYFCVTNIQIITEVLG